MRQLQHPTWQYKTLQEQLEAIVKRQDERIDRILGDVVDEDEKEVEKVKSGLD